MTGVRCALFDLDDTLFDHRHAASSALQEIQPELPRFAGRPFEELERAYSELLEEVHLRVLSGALTLDDARAERIGRLMNDGTPPAEDAVLKLARRFRESYQTSRRSAPGAVELLEALRGRGVDVGIVTNNQTSEQEEKLRHLGLDRLVDFMVTSEDFGRAKPDPAIFEFALERAGCAAPEAVMFGDSWESDVVGATRAGVRAVWFNPRSLLRPKTPDLRDVTEVHTLEPLDAALEAIIPKGPG